MQILADMSKMKTRCKHILDVTDRYCVLTETCPTISPNLSADDESKDDSIDSTDTTDSTGSVVKLRGNVVKTTVSSLSSHLAVIAKTYTKRHSSSNLNQTTWRHLKVNFWTKLCVILKLCEKTFLWTKDAILPREIFDQKIFNIDFFECHCDMSAIFQWFFIRYRTCLTIVNAWLKLSLYPFQDLWHFLKNIWQPK